jgi:superfamily II DNA/RNA helicase
LVVRDLLHKFLPDVEKIIGLTPENRQTLLFSATMRGEIVSLSRRYLRQPTNIRAEAPHEAATVPQTVQHVFRAHALDKREVVARVLQAEGRGLTMIFCQTKRAAQQLADDLDARGFAAAAVHGDLGQGAREQALRAFRAGKVDVLVATDVAARGIDVEGVTHVVNYECPDDGKTYLHRIGRTGRAGASGVAVTFVDWDDLHRWSLINRDLGLSFDEPLETYSTSEHLYDMLGIPTGATGVLPPELRTRAGLSAEQVEDIGETGSRRWDRRGGSGPRERPREVGQRRGRQGSRRRSDESRTTVSSPREQNDKPVALTTGSAAGEPSPSPQPRSRRRRRLRAGIPVSDESAGTDP